MADYLFALLGSNRKLSFQGDDDGGRLFHPFGPRDQFGRATLATCGVLLGSEERIGTQSELAEQAAWWIGAEVLEQAVAASREQCIPLFPGLRFSVPTKRASRPADGLRAVRVWGGGA